MEGGSFQKGFWDGGDGRGGDGFVVLERELERELELGRRGSWGDGEKREMVGLRRWLLGRKVRWFVGGEGGHGRMHVRYFLS